MKPRVVTIFTKPECSLCEEAEEVIEAVRARLRPFELDRRNILDDLHDYDRYKHDIPVILVDGAEIARHHLTEAQLESALATTFVIMAKYPTPGCVKTRLVPPLTHEQAAELHRTFLLHLVGRLRGRHVIVCHGPPDAADEMQNLVEVDIMPQSEGDLGQRLAAAAARVAGDVIFLGVDSPDVPTSHLARVTELLTSHDVVIGPAADGGYWSVALTPAVDASKLFAGIEWPTGRECAQTLERAKHLGYNIALADRWDDVDRPEDLRRLLERLRRSDAADRELLGRLKFLPDGVVST